ncbi:hypothetical protein QBC34DRAFT_496345 [Podospora aff. communis PSN243]|uniref:Uncharacterized protein n=1 Tax=Podospora aff. communis PSN243 TaxID=3040156 RepID=A0AAV9GIQ2_9PEZI|nr:hypothetical protein QBC34DRAFT_496345 [Podospora aff. communis PSN243]
MPTECPADCFEPPRILQPNPDIGGTGVLVGFIGTAWFVVILVVLYFPFALQRAYTPLPRHFHMHYRDEHDPVMPMHYCITDNFLENLVRSGSFVREMRALRFKTALENLMLTMCDVQILTGCGVLISGYINLSCYVSAYHWKLVVYLAWASNITHVACLSALRGYFQEHKRERNIRLFFMTLMWLALLVAMVPTAFFDWEDSDEASAASPASSARCFFNVKIGRQLLERAAPGTRIMDVPALKSMICSLLLLAFGTIVQILKLFPSQLKRTRQRFREPVSRSCISLLLYVASLNRGSSLRPCAKLFVDFLVVKPMIGAYLVCKLYADFLSSIVLLDISWLLISALWGSCRLSFARQTVTTGPENLRSPIVGDKDWGFGQILPVFLLVGPIVMAIEAFVVKRPDEDGARPTEDQIGEETPSGVNLPTKRSPLQQAPLHVDEPSHRTYAWRQMEAFYQKNMKKAAAFAMFHIIV